MANVNQPNYAMDVKYVPLTQRFQHYHKAGELLMNDNIDRAHDPGKLIALIADEVWGNARDATNFCFWDESDKLHLKFLAFPLWIHFILFAFTQETCVGFLLGGIGELNRTRLPDVNFLVVDNQTNTDLIKETLRIWLKQEDIAIIVLTYPVAVRVRRIIMNHQKLFPVIIEIPCKFQPYDPKLDTILIRAKAMIPDDEGSTTRRKKETKEALEAQLASDTKSEGTKKTTTQAR